MARHRHLMTLVDLATGRQLSQDGRIKAVAKDGTAKVSIASTIDGAFSTDETIAFTSGKIEFFTATTDNEVDIYYYTDKGYCGVIKGAGPGDVSEVAVDLNRLNQTLLFPFDASDADFTAASDIDTKIELGDEVQLLPSGIAVQVLTADATETIDVGVTSTSGVTDTDGIIDGLSVATAGMIPAQVGFAVGSNAVYLDITGGDVEWTLGALLHATGTKVALAEGADTNTDFGSLILEPHIVDGSSAANQEKLTYNISTGSDTAAGIISIPTLLPQPRV